MDKHRKGSSYVLWLGILFGLGGLHRLYNGKVATMLKLTTIQKQGMSSTDFEN